MMAKKGGKPGEGDRDRPQDREDRESGGSATNSCSERLTTLEKTLAAAMGKIDSILHCIEKIDLDAIGGGGGGGAGSTKVAGIRESRGGLHFPKSISRLETMDASINAEEEAEALALLRTDLNGGPDGREGSPARKASQFNLTRASSEGADPNDEGEEVEKPVLNDSDAWMINPTKKFRMTWDLSLIMPFLIYLTVMMPFRLCFANEARYGTALYWFEFCIDLVFIADIFLNFRTGVFVGRDQSEGGELVEYDRWLIASAYLQTWYVHICSARAQFFPQSLTPYLESYPFVPLSHSLPCISLTHALSWHGHFQVCSRHRVWHPVRAHRAPLAV
jgi:hypothetical protein